VVYPRAHTGTALILAMSAVPPNSEKVLSDEEADDRLSEIVKGFFLHRHRQEEPTAQRLLINAPPGLGKTARAIAEGLRHSIGYLPAEPFKLGDIREEFRQVALFVPTHKLAGQIGADVAELFADGSMQGGAFAMRGRTQGKEPLCLRAAEASALAAKGLPIYSNLCDDGQGSRCPHFSSCRYIEQKREAKAAEIVTATHKHLPTGACPDSDYYWDPRLHSDVWVIDEDPTASLYQDDTEITRRDVEGLGDLGKEILVGLTAAGGLLTHLAEKGWTADRLRNSARQREAVEMGRSRVTKPANEIRTANLKEFRPLAPVIARLADEMASERGGAAYSLAALSANSLRVRWRWRLDYAPDQPILITDGTANVEILRQFIPDLVEERLAVRRNAQVVQVSDRTFSKHWLLNSGGLEQVARFIAAKATQYPRGPGGGGLLVVTNKAIRIRLTGERAEGTLPISTPALGADIAHFGHIRGANDFAKHDAIIILGRRELPIDVAEARAMALWYDTPDPLSLLSPDDLGRLNYPEVDRDYQMRDGTRQPGKARAHPDPRVQAVIEQDREAESLQAIDRLRLVRNKEPKPVFILCSIPLPGLEVDRLVTWRALFGDEKLHKALSACAGPPVSALPLSARWLTRRFPDLWKTEDAAKSWLRTSGVAEMLDRPSKGGTSNIVILAKSPFERPSGPSLCGEPIPPEIIYWRSIEYRMAARAGGRPSRALVADGTEPAAAIAGALRVDLGAVTIIKREWSAPSYGEDTRTAD
jgi:hypothetical protein